MSTTTASAPSTKVVIGPVRFSYLNVFTPRAQKGSTEEKYSLSILISKKDKGIIAKINEAVEAAKEVGKAKLAGGKGKLKLPLHDGDVDREEDADYAGHYYLTASSKTKPGLVDKDRQQIMDQDELYSGCYGYASLNFFAYNNESKGIGCGLQNLMKTKDGEPLGGTRSKPEEDFASVEIADDDLL